MQNANDEHSGTAGENYNCLTIAEVSSHLGVTVVGAENPLLQGELQHPCDTHRQAYLGHWGQGLSRLRPAGGLGNSSKFVTDLAP